MRNHLLPEGYAEYYADWEMTYVASLSTFSTIHRLIRLCYASNFVLVSVSKGGNSLLFVYTNCSFSKLKSINAGNE